MVIPAYDEKDAGIITYPTVLIRQSVYKFEWLLSIQFSTLMQKPFRDQIMR